MRPLTVASPKQMRIREKSTQISENCIQLQPDQTKNLNKVETNSKYQIVPLVSKTNSTKIKKMTQNCAWPYQYCWSSLYMEGNKGSIFHIGIGLRTSPIHSTIHFVAVVLVLLDHSKHYYFEGWNSQCYSVKGFKLRYQTGDILIGKGDS